MNRRDAAWAAVFAAYLMRGDGWTIRAADRAARDARGKRIPFSLSADFERDEIREATRHADAAVSYLTNSGFVIAADGTTEQKATL